MKRKKAPRRSPTTLGTLDDFLKEEGKHEEFEAAAVKEVLAWQIAEGRGAPRPLDRKSMRRRAIGVARPQR